jgi:hypothetical protein
VRAVRVGRYGTAAQGFHTVCKIFVSKSGD